MTKSTLEQWRMFRAVVEHGGFAQAAEATHKSQSSINHAVHKLQDQLNLKLLEVVGRKAQLTDAGALMLRRADQLLEHAVHLETIAAGLSQGNEAELRVAVVFLRYYAYAAVSLVGDPAGGGVAFSPGYFPLAFFTGQIAASLAAGNAVVLKPAESASLSLLRVAELALEAGLPEGVLNVVTGAGPVTGEALALSMEVDVLVFTGSGATGRRLLNYSASSNLKRCYLELGGKSPNIVFNDAPDLAEAARVSAAGIFRNSGQECVAGSRLLVQEDIHDDFVTEICKHADAFRVGDPLDLASQIGAVHSRPQLEANLRFVANAEAEGAERRTGGARILEETGGYYMQPTVMTNVKPTDTLATREVFGPVLAVTPFKDESDAIRIANGTELGLAAGVWTRDLVRAHRMISAIRAGVVHVNTYGGADLTVPLGGVKQSGNGHDKSPHALDKYHDLKTAWIQL